MLRLLAVCIVFAFCVPLARGQVWVPKYSNEFLSIGVGAAGMGLSGTQAAVAQDITAAYWNPAGLASMTRKNEIALMHASYFAGIANYDYAAFATQVDTQSTLAISFVRLGIDNIPDTRYLVDNGQVDYRRISMFSSSDNALFFSYGRRNVFKPGLSVGGSLKVIYRNAGKFANAWGFGLDAGAQYNVGKWRIGLMARDIATTFNAWSYNTTELEKAFVATGNTIPESSVEITLPTWTLGLARRVELLPNKLSAKPMADFVMSFDGKRNTLVSSSVVSVDPRFGLEIKAFELVALRGGISGWQRVKNFENGTDWGYQINFGLGLQWKSVTIDYAMTDLGNQAETLYSNIFSLKASF